MGDKNTPMSIKQGWGCTGANFDCEKPFIEVTNNECSKTKKISIPESVAYYLRTHFCGSRQMHNGLKADAVRDLQNKFKQIMGMKGGQ